MGRQVVLISGGSRGLGAAIAGRCLDLGHAVAAFSRSITPFLEEQRARDAGGAHFVWAPVDGRDDEGLKRFVDMVAERYGGIDVLVNNAAVGRFGPFPLMRLADLDESLGVNLRANILLARLCTPHMLSRAGG